MARAALGPYRQLPGGTVTSRAADVMGDRLALAGLGAVCALLSFCLPERAPYPALYARSLALLDGLGAERWADAYLGWELALLTEMGFGLSLETCAVTGSTEDLIYVSPRTGRAVSRKGAGDWADRLLPFPPCLTGPRPKGPRTSWQVCARRGISSATTSPPRSGTRRSPQRGSGSWT
jgi:hypothetical protein